MDGLAEEYQGSLQFIHIHAQIVDECHQCAHHVYGIWWTAGNVDSLVFQIGICFIYAFCASGIWACGLYAAKTGTGANGHVNLGLGQDFLANIIHGLAANIAILAIQGIAPSTMQMKPLGEFTACSSASSAACPAAAMMVSW